MSDLFQKIMIDDIDLPAMPEIAIKVFSMLDNGNFSLTEFENTVLEDQSLIVSILKIANAPIYKTGKSANTLSDAIMIIGLDNLLALVSIIALTNQLSGKYLDPELMRHSMAVSSASALLAQRIKGVKREEALVAGLIHDIGKTVLSVYAHEQYKAIKSRAKNEGRPFIEIEDELLGFNHCNIGSILAAKWKFPKIYEHVIKHHHEDKIEGRSLTKNTLAYEDLLCYTVRVADYIASDAGVSVEKPFDKRLTDLMKVLDIDKTTYDEIKKELLTVN
ncbi:MAG: HDOD domain-containing protein [Dissulfurispiraceae bacterium]